jgi:hypothetical protein
MFPWRPTPDGRGIAEDAVAIHTVVLGWRAVTAREPTNETACYQVDPMKPEQHRWRRPNAGVYAASSAMHLTLSGGPYRHSDGMGAVR